MRHVLLGVIVAACGCHGELTPGDTPGGPRADAGSATAFRPDVQADLDSNGCTASTCHALAGTPMLVLAAPSDDGDWQANYDEVVARSGSASSSLLLAKPSGLGGHVTVFGPSSPVIDRWTEWISDGVLFE